MSEQVQIADAIDTSALLNAVKADPHRKGSEKESRVLWSGSADSADVYSAEPSVMRRLLCHPEFTLQWFEAVRPGKDDHHTQAYHVDKSDGLSAWDGEPVYALEGELPIGCVLMKGQARRYGSNADTVTEGVLENDPRKEESS